MRAEIEENSSCKKFKFEQEIFEKSYRCCVAQVLKMPKDPKENAIVIVFFSKTRFEYIKF